MEPLTNFIDEANHATGLKWRRTNLVLDIPDECLELFFKLPKNARTHHDCREIN